MDKIKLTPLSINEAFQGKRFKTAFYKRWEKDGLWILKNYKGMRPKKWFGIEIILHCVSLARRDIDNVCKPILDLLTKAEIIKDDRYCLDLHIKKEQSAENYLTFEVTEMAVGKNQNFWVGILEK